MKTDLIIELDSSEINVALLRDDRLIELQKEKPDNSFSVGDIYLGRVKKLVPGLNAAFVDVGYEKDGFLHYHDLGPQVKSLMKFVRRTISGKLNKPFLADFQKEKDIHKDGKITDVLSANKSMLVQVAKEPISTKGPRISSEISLAGRYVILVPFSDRISVSQKITDSEERDRLKRLVQSIRPKGFGVIIRTVAATKKVAELDADIRRLTAKWELVHKNLKNARPPFRILGEMNRVSSILRDILNDSFTNIIVNDAGLMEEVKEYLQRIAPEKEKIVKLHKGKTPIFEHYGIEKQIKAAFGRSVSVSKGAYLIIEHTEACHVIDVNSGNRSSGQDNQEANALDTNMHAAEEIARQLRLRDMGGIIVVDFIDMQKAENRKKLFEHLKECMKDDRAKHKILPPSRFGLVEITRQRVRPETNIKTGEKCPTCKGTGEIQPSILVIDEVKAAVNELLSGKKIKGLTLCAHPFIAAFLTNGFPSLRQKWFWKYKKWVEIRPMDSYTSLEYRFFNAQDDEISL